MKKFKKLSRNDRHMKVEALYGYLEGGCCILAVAFHREFGEQIVFLSNSNGFVHACTRTANGKFRDARGVINSHQVAGSVFDLPDGHLVQEVSESEVFAFTNNGSSKFGDREIEIALHRAQVAWPHWPWKNSFLKRGLAFLADLERISKEHGVYLHGTVPAAPPVLSNLQYDHMLKHHLSESAVGQHFFLGTN